MPQVFADRFPTEKEVEKLRLILSTYQDGTGMLNIGGRNLPGWRDFERATAIAFGGRGKESKAICDVLFSYKSQPGIYYGVDCKMRGDGGEVNNRDRATLEVSNASGEFWSVLNSYGLTQDNYIQNPSLVGQYLLNTVESWHQGVSHKNGGNIHLSKCHYLNLSWNRKTLWYQLYLFPFDLPNPELLNWEFPPPQKWSIKRRVVGKEGSNKIIEWYGESGGQLKYYPKIENAIWKSSPFQLEPLHDHVPKDVLAKTIYYFSKLWANAQE